MTLRYDKRVSGQQANENLSRMMGKISKQGHVDELAGGMQLLIGHKAVDSRHIFALTNSEGCLHAMNYQLQPGVPPFAGLLLTSAPARPVGEVAHSQLAAQLAAVPGGDQMLASYDQAINDFLAGQVVKMDESLPEGIQNLLLSVTNPINQPFSRELVDDGCLKIDQEYPPTGIDPPRERKISRLSGRSMARSLKGSLQSRPISSWHMRKMPTMCLNTNPGRWLR